MSIEHSATPQPKRRWYQFRLRTLLVVFLVGGLGIGWLAGPIQGARKQRSAAARVRQLGGEAVYGMVESPSYPDGVYFRTRLPMKGYVGWQRDLLGEAFVQRLNYVRLASNKIRDTDLECLQGLPYLEYLDLTQTAIAGPGLAHLKGLDNLWCLVLSRTALDDDGLKHLEGLVNVRHLDLGGTKITDAGLVHLNALKNLESLNVAGTAVRGSGFAHIEDKNTLVGLFLGSQVDDEGIKSVADFTQLRTLVLSSDKLSRRGLRYLHNLRNLVCLDLPNLRTAKGVGLDSLAGMTDLKQLYLVQAGVTDADLASLSRLTNLETLDLQNNHITDKGLAHLRGLTSLQVLFLSSQRPVGSGYGPGPFDPLPKITEAGLQHLKGLGNLTSLSLDRIELTPAALAEFKKALPKCQCDGLGLVPGARP